MVCPFENMQICSSVLLDHIVNPMVVRKVI